MATHSSILAWRIPWTEEPGQEPGPWGHKESDGTEATEHPHTPDTYMHMMEDHPAIKKNEMMPFATTWMKSQIIILSDVSKTEKDKYTISFICGI